MIHSSAHIHRVPTMASSLPGEQPLLSKPDSRSAFPGWEDLHRPCRGACCWWLMWQQQHRPPKKLGGSHHVVLQKCDKSLPSEQLWIALKSLLFKEQTMNKNIHYNSLLMGGTSCGLCTNQKTCALKHKRKSIWKLAGNCKWLIIYSIIPNR